MFTGIIENTGQVVSLAPSGISSHLRVDAGAVADGLKIGTSVAVNGVCLTVSHIDGCRVGFDVIHETLDRSTLGSWRVGERVNLERSLAVGDRLDGHFVQGHVDGRARVRRRIDSPREFVLWLDPDPPLLPYIIPKGSIALDGVSLTIAALRGTQFSVALVPTTLERTTLGLRREGHLVNVETDVLVRTIVHRMDPLQPAAGLTLERVMGPNYP